MQRAVDGGRVRGVLLDGSPATAATEGPYDILALLGDRSTLAREISFRVEEAGTQGELADYRRLRQDVFVHEQGLFDGHDLDDRDTDPRMLVLVAKDAAGTVLGGVRLGPVDDGPDLGWWAGGRLVVAPSARGLRGIGAALVRAACARAEAAGVLRFDATVQARGEPLFRRLGWRSVRPAEVANTPHMLMRWPIGRIAEQAAATKSALGPLLAALLGRAVGDAAPDPVGGAPGSASRAVLGGVGFVGDD
ncbi:MSMEG_0567/Sll0786 family nitrogen starvation N-acetyltransferase, partial [Streptomyces sp. NPDC001980]|uniref:MSMEG_0567/Sll0786 family nitrogen starvation N-acetyltransferase n=1 Tax=Streptomyces sp. NPDC001980 TaxID=3157126 RepID=UPI003332C65B